MAGWLAAQLAAWLCGWLPFLNFSPSGAKGTFPPLRNKYNFDECFTFLLSLPSKMATRWDLRTPPRHPNPKRDPPASQERSRGGSPPDEGARGAVRPKERLRPGHASAVARPPVAGVPSVAVGCVPRHSTSRPRGRPIEPTAQYETPNTMISVLRHRAA